MNWNVWSPPLNWNEMKWKVYSFFNSGCEMKINEINSSLMTVKWGAMKWNSWNLVKLVIFFGLVIKTHGRDRENQQKDLLNSMKSQSFSTYQSFRPRDPAGVWARTASLGICVWFISSTSCSSSSSCANSSSSSLTDIRIWTTECGALEGLAY